MLLCGVVSINLSFVVNVSDHSITDISKPNDTNTAVDRLCLTCYLHGTDELLNLI